jgi:hypothetical protein
MAIDNEIYNRMSETRWDEKGFLKNLLAYNDVRFGYFRKVLFNKLKIELNGGNIVAPPGHQAETEKTNPDL